MIIPPGGHRDDTFGPWLRTILTRRRATTFREDGPTDGELEAILAAAVSVADDDGAPPWRFTVIDGSVRLRFADVVRAAAQAAGDRPGGDRIRRSIRTAPTVIAVVTRCGPSARCGLEARDSAARAAYVIALAAHELGLGSRWQAAPRGDHQLLSDALSMAPGDAFVGWVELGRVAFAEEPRVRCPIRLHEVVQVMVEDGAPVPYGGPRVPVRDRRQRVR